VVARIYDPSRAAVYQGLGIPVVATVRWAAQQVLGHLIDLGPEVVWRHPTAEVRLTVMAYHPGWVGRPIGDTERDLAARVPLLGRYGSAVVTTADMALQDHDELYVAHEAGRAEDLARRLARPPAGPIRQES
jgi:trk system potassium uptake protein TrkA